MRNIRALFWLAILLAATVPAGAQTVFEKLISPGPLAAKHAKLEARCEACHLNFKKEVQSQLCNVCHKAVGADIAAGRGFHGKFHPASGECSSCHIDHAGRDAIIIKFDKASFNHDFTDYPLTGRHVGLKCESCHTGGRKYRDAPVKCVGCHQKDDKHKGSLGPNCASCHAETGWKVAKFDHNTTKFPLLGAHARATCQSCHADSNFAATPRECISCHQKKDVHKGGLGTDCAKCHDAVDWKPGFFDHDHTTFPLVGKHVNTPCKSCHVEPAGSVRLPGECVDCHRKDDAHKGGDGPECAQCHTAFGWKETTFNHDRTTFPLRGKHVTTPCTSCHVQPPREKKIAADCFSCHGKDDKHAGQLGPRCESCHDEVGWKHAVRFDHGLAPFPLLGKHATTACADCHKTPRFKDASTSCGDCHAKDDIHKGSLGVNCAACHNAATWAKWTFNHDTQTQFALTGAHATISCNSCHKTKGEKVSQVCGDCHLADDVHQGAFGRSCGRCHSTQDFKALHNRF